MLLDHRTYTVRVGTLRKQLALYEKHGFEVQKRHFGEPLGWLVSETGDVNTYVHIWIYENADDRNRRRAALYKDPEWLKYIEMNAEAGYLIKQESKLMSPAPFAPLKR
jgi:NIPSNAP protein